MRVRVGRRLHLWWLGRSEDSIDGVLMQCCHELSLLPETLNVCLIAAHLVCGNVGKLLDDCDQASTLLLGEAMTTKMIFVQHQQKTALVATLHAALRREGGSLAVGGCLLLGNRTAMLVQPCLVADALLSVLVRQ